MGYAAERILEIDDGFSLEELDENIGKLLGLITVKYTRKQLERPSVQSDILATLEDQVAKLYFERPKLVIEVSVREAFQRHLERIIDAGGYREPTRLEQAGTAFLRLF